MDTNTTEKTSKTSLTYNYDTKRFGLCEGYVLAYFKNLIKFFIAIRDEQNVEDHFRDEKVWVFHTTKRVAEKLEFLSYKQVRRAIDYFVEAGVLIREVSLHPKFGAKFSRFALGPEEFKIFLDQTGLENPFDQPVLTLSDFAADEDYLKANDLPFNHNSLESPEMPYRAHGNAPEGTGNAPEGTSTLLYYSKNYSSFIDRKKKEPPKKGPIAEFSDDPIISPYLKGVSDKLQAIWLSLGTIDSVKRELKDAICWLISHPSRQKKNYGAFFNNWLKKARDDGKFKRGTFQADKYHQEVINFAKVELGPNVDLSSDRAIKLLDQLQKDYDKFHKSK